MSIELLSSNLNVAQLDVVTRSSAWYEDFIGAAGYQGLELTPAGRIGVEAALGHHVAAGMIRSTHQSFVKNMTDLPFSAVMPQVDHSLAWLKRVQAHVGVRELPVVVYPNEQMPPRDTPGNVQFDELTGLGPLRWQLTPEVIMARGIGLDDTAAAAQQVQEYMAANRFSGLVYDTYHTHDVSRVEVLDGTKWSALIGELAVRGAFHEVHLSLARTDRGGDGRLLDALYGGHLSATPEGEIVRQIHDTVAADSPLIVTVESPAGLVGDVRAKHRDIVDAISAEYKLAD